MTEDLFTYAASHTPFQKHSPTSRAAAEAIKPRIGALHRAIMGHLQYYQGATDEEMQDALAMAANTQRPRRRELQQAGLILDSGTTRKTRSGRQAVVWVLGKAP